jgi:hypothetical protein
MCNPALLILRTVYVFVYNNNIDGIKIDEEIKRQTSRSSLITDQMRLNFMSKRNVKARTD